MIDTKSIPECDFLKHFTGYFWCNLPNIMFSYMDDALMELFCLLRLQGFQHLQSGSP